MKHFVIFVLAAGMLPTAALSASASPCGTNCRPYERNDGVPKPADVMRGHLIDGSKSDISGPSGRGSARQPNPRSKSAK